MIRKTVLTIATATIISAAAMTGTASTASAKVYLNFDLGGFGHGGHGGWGHGGYDGYDHYNPCQRWLKKYNWTGKRRYLRKYRRCMRNFY